MALAHAHPGDIIDLRPLGNALLATPSRALLRSPDLELLHLVLIQGDRIPSHAFDGACTLHVLEGRVRVDLGHAQPVLQPAQMLMLEAGSPHAIEAIADTSLLLTMVRGSPPSPGPDGPA